MGIFDQASASAHGRLKGLGKGDNGQPVEMPGEPGDSPMEESGEDPMAKLDEVLATIDPAAADQIRMLVQEIAGVPTGPPAGLPPGGMPPAGSAGAPSMPPM